MLVTSLCRAVKAGCQIGVRRAGAGKSNNGGHQRTGQRRDGPSVVRVTAGGLRHAAAIATLPASKAQHGTNDTRCTNGHDRSAMEEEEEKEERRKLVMVVARDGRWVGTR